VVEPAQFLAAMIRVTNPLIRALLRSPAGGPMRWHSGPALLSPSSERRDDIPVLAHRARADRRPRAAQVPRRCRRWGHRGQARHRRAHRIWVGPGAPARGWRRQEPVSASRPISAGCRSRWFMRAAGTPCGLLEQPDVVPGVRGAPRAGARPAGGQAGAARPRL